MAKLRVLIAGGGVAALEAALALKELARGLTATTLLAPNSELVYRAMTVREPFGYPRAGRWALEPLVQAAGAELRAGELASVDAAKRIAHTRDGDALEYDALLVALGARMRPRYEHAITIDDRHLDETLEGLLQDIEAGYTHSIAFVAPGRMGWLLPIYELALMTAGRAYDADLELRTAIVTPEDRPLAIFGQAASDAVAELLERKRIETITSAYAEVPRAGEVVVMPGDRDLRVERIVALPELFGPDLRGLPVAEHGFIGVDPHGHVLGDTGPAFAAGDATAFPVKHGGLAAEEADAAAESIAALAGASLTPQPFKPEIRGMLLTDERPLYISASISGGQGFSSRVSEEPPWAPRKVTARFLGPLLEAPEHASALDA